MEQPPPYHLDVDELKGPGCDPASTQSGRNRPWIGIHFDCCHVYTRIYRNAQGTAYHGQCARCFRAVTLNVGPGGTDARFFKAE